MTTFAGEIGSFHDPFPAEKPYEPSLPIVPVFNLFNKIPKEGPWQIPKSFQQQENWDELLQKWVRYFDHASEGNQIYLKSINENVVEGAYEDVQAAIYFDYHGLHADTKEGSLEKIGSVRRAFAELLSKKSRKHLKLEGNDIHASPEDIQNARTLITNFERDMYVLNLVHEEERD